MSISGPPGAPPAGQVFRSCTALRPNTVTADRFLEEFDINFDIVYDPKGELAESFNIKGMPTSYLYNRKGELIGTHIGFKNKDTSVLSAAIAAAIESGE